jgi:hypothetical protein
VDPAVTSWRQQIDNDVTHAAIVQQHPNGSTDLEAHLVAITDPQSGKKVGKLTPAAAASWQAMAAHAWRDGVVLLPTSPADSFRPLAVQQRIFADRYTTTDQGNGSRVCSGKRWWKRKGVATAACPGTSNHGRGEAVDVSDASGARLAWLEEHARTYGWAWELDSEPWHLHYLLGDALPPGIDQEADDLTPDEHTELLNIRQTGINTESRVVGLEKRTASIDTALDQIVMPALGRLEKAVGKLSTGGVDEDALAAKVADLLAKRLKD